MGSLYGTIHICLGDEVYLGWFGRRFPNCLFRIYLNRHKFSTLYLITITFLPIPVVESSECGANDGQHSKIRGFHQNKELPPILVSRNLILDEPQVNKSVSKVTLWVRKTHFEFTG